MPRARKAPVLPGPALLAAGAVLLGAALLFLFPWASGQPDDRSAQPRSASTMPTDLQTVFEERRGPPLSGPWRLTLPEDHGAHPQANAETWAVFMHLRTPEGTPVSSILTLSRFGVAPETGDTDTPWAPQTAWLGQAALAQPGPRAEERLSRGAGAAGFDARSGTVWLDDWVMRHPTEAGTGSLSLQARIEGHPLDLMLRPVKAPVAPGEVTEGPTRGFAMPRLEVSGQMGPDGASVQGVAWVDRLWGDLPAPGGPLVYDRVIVHLDDGTDLALLRTRRRDGRGSATIDGVLVDAAGTVTALTEAATWTEGDGPGIWKLNAPDLALQATELPGSGLRDFAVPVWHAGLVVEGTRAGRAVGGAGTLLLSPEATP